MRSSIRAVLTVCAVAAVSLLGLPSAHAATPAGTWLPAGTMQIARADAAATVLADGRVLVTGGSVKEDPNSSSSSYPGGAVTDKVDVYNPATGAWSPAASMPTPRRNHQAVLLPDGRVLVLGGQEYTDRQYTPSQHIYNPTTNTWTTAPGFSPSGAVVALPDGRVLADDGHYVVTYLPVDGAQGAIGAQYNLDSNGFYGATATTLKDGTVLFTHADGGAIRVDVVANSVTVLPKYETPDINIGQRTATLLNDGTVLLAGGIGWTDYSQPDHAVAEVERFNPATNTWMAAPDMPAGRRGPLAARLNNGQVLVAGGWADPFFDGGPSYLFDPVANAWSTTASIPGLYGGTGFRFTQMGARLADGTVLLIGGYGQGGFLDRVDRFVIDADDPTVKFGDGNQATIRPVLGYKVRGTAKDATSGVASVVLHGTPQQGTADYEFAYTADLDCNAARTSCQWSTRVYQGVWSVTATVTDRAGHSTTSAPQTIIGQAI